MGVPWVPSVPVFLCNYCDAILPARCQTGGQARLLLLHYLTKNKPGLANLTYRDSGEISHPISRLIKKCDDINIEYNIKLWYVSTLCLYHPLAPPCDRLCISTWLSAQTYHHLTSPQPHGIPVTGSWTRQALTSCDPQPPKIFLN